MSLETVHIPIRDLEPHPKNAKQHDEPLLLDSVKYFGQYRTIVVQAPRGRRKKHRVLAGHGTWYAMQQAGLDSVACNVHDIDDDTALRIVAIDNRSTELGGWDQTALVEMLASLPDLDHTGYDDAEFERLKDQFVQEGDAPVDEPLVERWAVYVDCVSEEQQSELVERLDAEGFDAKAIVA